MIKKTRSARPGADKPLKFHVLYKGGGDSTTLSRWLESNCQGAYRVEVHGPGPATPRGLNVDLFFEYESDLSQFRKSVNGNAL